ncbi:hypothetical protein LguiA_002152 [Lonicera macranthoides]
MPPFNFNALFYLYLVYVKCIIYILGHSQFSHFLSFELCIYKSKLERNTRCFKLLGMLEVEPKHKGKISRSLAAQTALAIRNDALGDGQDNSMDLENRLKSRS